MPSNPPPSTPRPNVIWVIADQMRAQAMSHRGDPNVSTPNLTRLAGEGVEFVRAMASSPLCCPARGSMLTGRPASVSGVPGHQSPLDTEVLTVANDLGSAGYRTAWIGKWHLDGNRPELGSETYGDDHARVRMIPPDRRGGFDDWWAYENNNRPFDTLVHTDAGKVPDGVGVLAEADGMQQFRLPGYETDCLTDILLSWLDARTPDEPFFGVLSVQPPHNPYHAPAPDMARHIPAQIRLRPNVPPIQRIEDVARRDLAGYYAAIERIDVNVGRIRAHLHELRLAENTYLVFLSDHGDMHGSHGQFRKTSPFEESIRIPLIIGGAGLDHAMIRSCDALITHTDLAPTTLGLCGVDVPDRMLGHDFSAGVTGHGRAPDPEAALVELPVPTGHHESVGAAWRTVVTSDGWKYSMLEDRPWCMYDTAEDPYELVDHAHDPAYRKRRDSLEAQLQALTESAATG